MDFGCQEKIKSIRKISFIIELFSVYYFCRIFFFFWNEKFFHCWEFIISFFLLLLALSRFWFQIYAKYYEQHVCMNVEFCFRSLNYPTAYQYMFPFHSDIQFFFIIAKTHALALNKTFYRKFWSLKITFFATTAITS